MTSNLKSPFRSLRLGLVLIFTLFLAVTSWAVGDGSKNSPYLIATAYDLANLRSRVDNGDSYENVYFKQTADIDMKDVVAWDGSEGSTIDGIGHEAIHPFRGHYDGQGYKISNLRISTSGKYAGLFGYIEGGSYNGTEDATHIAEVHGVVLENPIIVVTASSDGGQYAGAVVAYAGNCARVYDCTVIGGSVSFEDVSSPSEKSYCAGGVVGSYQNGNFARLSGNKVSGTTVSGATLSGGLAGFVQYNWIIDGNVVDAYVSSSQSDYNGPNGHVKDYRAGALVGNVNIFSNSSHSQNVNYYHSNDNLTAFGKYISGTTFAEQPDNEDVAQIYTVTSTADGLALSGDASYTIGSARYYVNGATATLRVEDKNKVIESVSATGATASLSNDKLSATLSVGKMDVTVEASLIVGGSCGSDVTWQMTDEDKNGTYETLNIGGTGAIAEYADGNAPWYADFHGIITRVNIGDDITTIPGNSFYGMNADIVLTTPALALKFKDAVFAAKIRVPFGNFLFKATETADNKPAYAISSADDLRHLASAVNAGNLGRGKIFYQTNDIDLGNENFTPIGVSTIFRGTYDGNRKIISGLKVSGDLDYAGLFGYVTQDRLSIGNVKNVILMNPSVSSDKDGADVGAIIGSLNGSASNCYFYGGDLKKAIGSKPDSIGATNVSKAYALKVDEHISVSKSADDPENGFQYDADNDGTPENYYREGLKLTLSHDENISEESTDLGYAFSYVLDGQKSDNISENTLTVGSAIDGKTLSVAFLSDGEKHQITYIDADGTTKTAEAIALDGSETKLTADWYFVGKDINYDHTLTFNGNANLILADGTKMEIETDGEYEHGIYASGDLVIYGQSSQSGTLEASAKGTSADGIYGYENIVINGGNVTGFARGAVCNGIFGYESITINGGNVYGFNEKGFAIYSKGDITVNGGNVMSTGYYFGIDSEKNVSINGGSVTATGNRDGIYSDDGIILSWTNPTDFIKASSYYSPKGSIITIAEGKSFTDEDGNVYSGTLNDDQLSAIKGKTLTPASVQYVDEDGNEKSIYNFTVLTADMATNTLPGGWYVIENSDPDGVDLALASTLSFSGDAYLILADGAQLLISTVMGGATGADAIHAAGKLTIYGQSNQSGSLWADGAENGINAKDGIAINGGLVNANGSSGNGFKGAVDIHFNHYNNRVSPNFSGPVTVSGLALTEGSGIYKGELNDEQIAVLKKIQLLEPCYVLAFDAQNRDDLVTVAATFDENGVAHIAKPDDPTRSGYTFLGWFTEKNGDTEFDFMAAVTANMTLYAKWGVPYIDENGEPQMALNCTMFTDATDVSDLPGGWYVVHGEVAYLNQVMFSGDAHLILADDATMVVKNERSTESGILVQNNLTVYGQSNQSGILNVLGDAYGIKGSENITINGGSVTATGNSEGFYSEENITLSWTNPTDFIKANSYYSKNGEIIIAEGKYFTDEEGNVYSRTLDEKQIVDIAGQKLTPVMPFPENMVVADISDTTYVGDSIRVEPDVLIGKNVLELGKDYTLAYEDNLNASEAAKVIVKGAGIYFGEVSKTFTIDKAPLEVTAKSDTIVYGDEAPIAGEVEYSGFVNGENEKSLNGTLVYSNAYTQYGKVGDYAISLSGLTADNYDITFVEGRLTVEKKFLSVEWEEQTEFTYDGKEHVPTVKAEGFVEGYEAALVVMGAAKNVGTHTATVALDENDANSVNYKLPGKEGLEREFKIVVPFDVKLLSDESIVVANIPVHNYKNGEPVCPKSIVVTDGKKTLKAGTDYTFECFNNTDLTSGTLDENAPYVKITGIGDSYAGEIEKRFFIWERIGEGYAAVQVYKDANNVTRAEIDGAYDGTDAVKIEEDIENVTVKFNRTFTPNSGFATIVLPFDVKANDLTGVRSIIEFDGLVEENGQSAVGMVYVWCNDELGRQRFSDGHQNCSNFSGELKAYTPYMIEMESATLGINGGVTLKATVTPEARVDDWVFRGTLAMHEWTSEEMKNTKIWGFAAQQQGDFKIGEFVPFGAGAWIRPFRAFMEYDPSGNKGSSGAPVPKGELGPTVASIDLPETMEVVIVSREGGEEHTTVIGRLNTRTGEIRLNSEGRRTFDLKGRSVGKPKAKGIYLKK